MNRKLYKQTNIFYNSQARRPGDEIYDHTAVFPTDLFNVEQGYEAELELIQFTVKQSYYNVDSLRNATFVYSEDSGSSEVTITLTNGNYNVKQLAEEIQTQLNANATALTWVVGYSLITLLFTFSYTGTPAGNVIFTEINNSFDLLGFASSESPKTITTPTTSSQIVSIGNIASLFLHCSFAKSRNIEEENVRDILCEVPILTGSFFGTIYYEKISDHSFTMKIPVDGDNSNTVTFSLKDIDNNPIRFTSDWAAVFSLNIYKKTMDKDAMNRLLMLNSLDDQK